MADSLPLDTATLAGLFASSILYGIFLVLLIGSLYILLYKRKTKQPNYVLILAAVIMFLLNTTVLAISFSRADDAFILDRDEPGGPIADLELLAQWKEVSRTALTCTYFVLADAILIYRCWIVWAKNAWIVVLPLILFLGSATVDIFMVVTMAGLHDGASIFVISLHNWITAVISLTLAQNIIVTSLIVFRIWRVNMSTAASAAGSLRPVMSIILESGVLYVASLFIFLMTYLAGSNSQYIMVDCINPMIGITFSLLIVRVGLGLPSAHDQTSYFRSQQTHQLRPMSIAVSRHFHSDGLNDSMYELEKVGEDAKSSRHLSRSLRAEDIGQAV